MSYSSCKIPCNKCPFRKDSKPSYTGPYTVKELHLIVMSERPYPCHQTHDVDITWEDTKEYPLCKGALLYMKKNGKSPREKELQELVNDSNPEDLDNILNLVEFFNHHKLEL